MGNILYALAAILIIFWIVGFFVYSAGHSVHFLLIAAALAVILKMSGRQRFRF